jgi:hypothetical protein
VPVRTPLENLLTSPVFQAFIVVVGILGTTASVIAVVLAVAWSPRKSNEQPTAIGKLPTIRSWRPRHYSQSLWQLQDFIKRYKTGKFYEKDERSRVTEYDLIRWIIQLSLTCAAYMMPQSLGKANLFRISQFQRDDTGHLKLIRVYASEFDGVFTAHQLMNRLEPTFLRDISYNPQETQLAVPAALQCVLNNEPVIQSLRRRGTEVDSPEKELGITHVLAIPLIPDFSDIVSDKPVSMTVDLRFDWLTALLVDKLGLYKKTMYRRAMQLEDTLRGIEALTSPQYLPPTDLISETLNPPREISGNNQHPKEPATAKPDFLGQTEGATQTE